MDVKKPRVQNKKKQKLEWPGLRFFIGVSETVTNQNTTETLRDNRQPLKEIGRLVWIAKVAPPDWQESQIRWSRMRHESLILPRDAIMHKRGLRRQAVSFHPGVRQVREFCLNA